MDTHLPIFTFFGGMRCEDAQAYYFRTPLGYKTWLHVEFYKTFDTTIFLSHFWVEFDRHQ